MEKETNGEMHEHNDCNCSDCGCECSCGCSCCGSQEGRELTIEEMDKQMTDAASAIWMKMFYEACEKEWKKKAGKNFQKMAEKYVKMSMKEWDEKMKKAKKA